jgi:hypothetical protein
MNVRHHNRESLSERQFKSGVFDVDYAAIEEEEMYPVNNKKLSAAEKERKLRDEELAERRSRTSRLKEEMNANNGDGKRKYATKFGSFSGAGAVDPSDVDEGRTSQASVTVTEEDKKQLQQQGLNTRDLEEGEEIPLAGLNWARPEDE